MTDEYPLEAARRLRASEVDEASRVLADAQDEERRAARNVAHAASDAEVAQARLLAIRAPQHTLRADALLRQSAFRDRCRRERDTTVEALKLAEATLKTTRDVVDQSRISLAQARAEAKAIERHFERWQEERRADQQRREEADADDRNSRFS